MTSLHQILFSDDISKTEILLRKDTQKKKKTKKKKPPLFLFLRQDGVPCSCSSPWPHPVLPPTPTRCVHPPQPRTSTLPRPPSFPGSPRIPQRPGMRLHAGRPHKRRHDPRCKLPPWHNGRSVIHVATFHVP